MNKSNKLLVGILAFVVVCVMGYALFSETITVTGTATAQGSFDITTTCVKGLSTSINTIADGIPGSGGDVKNSTCSVNGSSVTFSTELGYPSSYQYYTLQFKNTGTIDALFPSDSDFFEKATGTLKVYLHSDNSLYQTITLPLEGSNKFVNNFAYLGVAEGLILKKDGSIILGGDSEVGRIVELSGTEYVRIKPEETLELLIAVAWPDNENDQVKDYYAVTTYNQNFKFKQYTMEAVDKNDATLCIGGC